jgi:hypothetical protein
MTDRLGRKLKQGPKFALLLLADAADKDLQCYPRAERLAEWMGTNERSARQHLQTLEAGGLIDVRMRGPKPPLITLIIEAANGRAVGVSGIDWDVKSPEDSAGHRARKARKNPPPLQTGSPEDSAPPLVLVPEPTSEPSKEADSSRMTPRGSCAREGKVVVVEQRGPDLLGNGAVHVLPDPVAEAVDVWHEVTKGKLQMVVGITDERRNRIRALLDGPLKEPGAWRRHIERLVRTDWIVERRFGIDWVIDPKRAYQLIEGAYDYIPARHQTATAGPTLVTTASGETVIANTKPRRESEGERLVRESGVTRAAEDEFRRQQERAIR